MKLSFKSSTPAQAKRQPLHTEVPSLRTAQLAAMYRAARVGGDFYDFVRIGEAKLLFVLLDIAGKRETALHVAASVQEFFRHDALELYTDPNIEDSEAVTHLLLQMNKTVMESAGGVCFAPAFLGCYDEDINTLTYINAGHTPGILRDEEGTLLLSANGLPLGLFSHSTHDSQYCALGPGALVALVSKGVVETKTAGQEFGIEGVQKVLEGNTFSSAKEICERILESVQVGERKETRFGPSFGIAGFKDHEPNDNTTLVLLRNP